MAEFRIYMNLMGDNKTIHNTFLTFQTDSK